MFCTELFDHEPVRFVLIRIAECIHSLGVSLQSRRKNLLNLFVHFICLLMLCKLSSLGWHKIDRDMNTNILQSFLILLVELKLVEFQLPSPLPPAYGPSTNRTGNNWATIIWIVRWRWFMPKRK